MQRALLFEPSGKGGTFLAGLQDLDAEKSEVAGSEVRAFVKIGYADRKKKICKASKITLY